MHPIDDFQQVRNHLCFWQGYNPSVKADLCSCALQIESSLWFIDPIPLADEPLERLLASSTLR